MKKFMKREIIECTRNPGGWGIDRKNAMKRIRDMEELPFREPMRVRRTKSFNDRLSPMYGFLYKNVGRPWNDVWSEICEHSDARSVDGWHFREHVKMAVDTTGEHRRYRFRDLYVDSEGILRCDHDTHSKWRKRRIQNHRDAKRRRKFTAGGRTYEKIDGFWFEVITRTFQVWDAHAEQYVTRTTTRKQQLNRNRLRDLGVKNDNQE